MLRRPVRRIAPACLPALLALLVLVPASPAVSAADGGLRIEGQAVFEDLERLGQFQLRLTLRWQNASERAEEVERAQLLLCHQGGWLTPLDPPALDGRLASAPETLEAGVDIMDPLRTYRVYTPAMHVVLDAGGAPRAFPIVRVGKGFEPGPAWPGARPAEGFEPPPPCRPVAPFGVGLVGPLDVLPFSDGTLGLMLVGQHQALAGDVPQDVETRVSVAGDKGATESITWEGLQTRGDHRALWPFVRRIAVYRGFERGTLGVEAGATLAGERVRFSSTWPVRRVEPAALRAPVLGAWQLSNGPGQTDLHDHYLWPQYRYAYDMVVLKGGRTHEGDPHANESYYAWNRSVRAAADGEIVALCALERDNPGYRGALTTCYDNHVVVRHEDGLHTAYLHIRKDSIARGLKLGTRVKAGQVIARVGNSGDSTEPHLHFMAFRIDATGRWRGVPVRFVNASHDPKGEKPVEGVPVAGAVYHFRDR